MIQERIESVKRILPNHYVVKESKEIGNVHAVSKIGIDDDEHWSYIMAALKQQKQFSDIYHNVCYKHTDLTIYYTKTEVR